MCQWLRNKLTNNITTMRTNLLHDIFILEKLDMHVLISFPVFKVFYAQFKIFYSCINILTCLTTHYKNKYLLS